ncbi:MAG: PilZ domain-containing protein [Alphaproteobacteria bacterium]|nr:PilZ domain-containing protein [Alphaproteobacteria bacterium]
MAQNGGAFGKRPAAKGSAPPKPTRPTDKRQGERTASFKSGQVFIGANKALDCAVRNLSKEGCMISLFGAENLPDDVEISVTLGQPRRKARVTWRDQQDAGLEFLPSE